MKNFILKLKRSLVILLTEDSKLENTDLKALSLELRDKLGVTPRILDLAVSKTAAKIKLSELNNAKVKARAFMNDKLSNQAVEMALEEQSAEYVSDFQKRLNTGEVSVSELNLLKSLKTEVAEAENSFGSGEVRNQSSQTEEEEYMHILQNQADIWCNASHPQYEKVFNRKIALQKRLGL